jgi:hypothetical protein
MQSTDQSIQTPAIGAPFKGGIFAGIFNFEGRPHALIRAPKSAGQHDDTPWNDSYKLVDGATSFNDGMANTEAMATAGSKVAQWARAQHISDHNDWYIPAQDELEILYRNLKPTTDENYLWGRSGLNASALPPTYPYTPNLPAQTPLALLQAGGEEALDPVWYWSSTQHAGNGVYAWCQVFANGGQDDSRKGLQFRVVLVRRSPL